MIDWGEPTFEGLAVARQAVALLEAASRAAPANPLVWAQLGYVRLDRFEFASAADAFEAALLLDPRSTLVRTRLAHCYNELRRAPECLALLSPEALSETEASEPQVRFERALALTEVGRSEAARVDLAAVLSARPHHHHALAALSRILRSEERLDEFLAVCAALAARGVAHSTLLLEWGRALALADDPRASQLMLQPSRVARLALPAPQGFASTQAFTAAFADELADHPVKLSELPKRDANRGSRRVHHLLAGGHPELVRALIATLQARIDELAGSLKPKTEFDAWPRAIPARARLNCWGLIQRPGEYEAWHYHPGGWMSGVCYMRVPASFSAAGEGAGCIEFGPPPQVAEAGRNACEPLRIAVEEGLLLLSPSHYMHRTIPFDDAGERISFAFDVVPIRDAA
ncbi:MAG TPA: putative 2OG-Fe(II) oxygenase [Caulobacteraceae bacterium]|jgi:tetratricopeptide (TPR) repeat protein|nr:putative 2OG-Fe(II) oxygenase [Caulobacteraceae bacterium]